MKMVNSIGKVAVALQILIFLIWMKQEKMKFLKSFKVQMTKAGNVLQS